MVHEDWPLHKYVTQPPHTSLTSRKPLWDDTFHVDMRDDWNLA